MINVILSKGYAPIREGTSKKEGEESKDARFKGKTVER